MGGNRRRTRRCVGHSGREGLLRHQRCHRHRRTRPLVGAARSAGRTPRSHRGARGERLRPLRSRMDGTRDRVHVGNAADARALLRVSEGREWSRPVSRPAWPRIHARAAPADCRPRRHHPRPESRARTAAAAGRHHRRCTRHPSAATQRALSCRRRCDDPRHRWHQLPLAPARLAQQHRRRLPDGSGGRRQPPAWSSPPSTPSRRSIRR